MDGVYLMRKNHFFISYGVTIVLYLSIAMMILGFDRPRVISEKDTKEQVMTFSLASFESESIPVPVVKEKKEEIVEPKKQEIVLPPKVIKPIKPLLVKEENKKTVPLSVPVVSKKEKVVKEKVKPKKKPKKKIKKTLKPKKPVKKTKKKKTKKKKQKKYKKRTSSKQSASRASQRDSGKKNKLLSTLRRKINSNKSYPRMAERRGIEGKVKVSFRLLKSGNISNLRLTGSKIFYSSAKRAVQISVPLNTAGYKRVLPINVKITLYYKRR